MSKLQIAYIDHYDSFSNNVIDWILKGSELIELKVFTFDDLASMNALAQSPIPTILSPGPGHPLEKKSTLGLVNALFGRAPILGICLGHQILAAASGAEVVKSSAPLHGACKNIILDKQKSYFFAEVTLNNFLAAVYNSLVIKPDKLGLGWVVNMVCSNEEVQGMENTTIENAPAVGVQFHPESFLSNDCLFIRQMWLRSVFLWYRQQQ